MRSSFDLSHEHKLSVDMGYLVPILTEEVLPGDTFIHRVSALARVAPLVHPLMHRCEIRIHSFYAANRTIWDELRKSDPNAFAGDWENFITGEDDTTPKPTYLTGSSEPLLDHMGIPPQAGLSVDVFPIAAYNWIWNEFYRDQDLQTERALTDTSLSRIAWQKDYFTVARPTTQQGDATQIPFSAGNIPVQGLATMAGSDPSEALTDTTTNTLIPDTTGWRSVHADTGAALPRVYADMSLATAGISIDDLRRSLALQRFAEARMRWGSRYVDYLRYLGVNPSDGRLDRPEYLGGGKEVLNFSEVLATAEGTSTQVGDMAGHGIALAQQTAYRKMFEEHGWVITLLSVRPKTVYSNALPRKFTRSTVMDYWQRELETLPWQEVNMQEVDVRGDPATVFGYVPKYEEYRHGMSHVSGTLRGGTENDWHMAREFPSAPSLNGSFIECTPTDRIYADSNQPNLIVNTMHSLKAARFVGQTASMGMGL